MTALVEFKNLTFSYQSASKPALEDLNLTLNPGQALLVTGRSGGGKSTFLRLLNGLAFHHFHGRIQGELKVLGENHFQKSLQEIAAEVAAVFQNPEAQFFGLTPKDEILIAWECRGLPLEKAHDLLEKWSFDFAINNILDKELSTLSSGEKQKTVLVENLALNPALLILDEPSANLDPQSLLELTEKLIALKKTGLSIVIVDHRLRWLAKLIDRAIILDDGHLAFEGSFKDLLNNTANFGLRSVTPVANPPLTANPNSLGVEYLNLDFAYPFKPNLFTNLSFTLPERTVTLVKGRNGCGKTTLMKITAGILKASKGEIKFLGKPLASTQRLSRSSLVPQNADRQLVTRSVREELEEATLGHKLKETTVLEELKYWNLLELSSRHPQSLSGGEKQRLALAVAMIRQTEFLALDEPTSGLDGINLNLAKNAIQKAAQTRSVFLITHDEDLKELIPCCVMNLDTLANNTF
ncbi:MAG: ATP-binding cassette domain-containing protein [Deltaproteobacteria bacterium]|nr:ATP-binding cassette domain-containing protein [Deltaproteobacteria bacterium]